ncbi:VanZ family protein [Chitinimonas sp. PSY-7]|uniref:VanZ family protein n=1 Tax=Chitinimonas sp. PSY-7 TaxID=3459088 RepID=UPI0040400B52
MNKTLMIPRKLGLVVGLLMIAAIFIGSLMPNPPLPDAPNSDKLAHLLGYSVLSTWWSLNLPRRPWIVFLVGSAFGVLIECLQALTPYRSFDPLDMLANSTGCLLGLLVAWLLHSRIKVTVHP